MGNFDKSMSLNTIKNLLYFSVLLQTLISIQNIPHSRYYSSSQRLARLSGCCASKLRTVSWSPGNRTYHLDALGVFESNKSCLHMIVCFLVLHLFRCNLQSKQHHVFSPSTAEVGLSASETTDRRRSLGIQITMRFCVLRSS